MNQDKKSDITTDKEEIQRLRKTYFKNLYYTKQENLKEMEKFLVIHNLPKLSLHQICNDVNRPINPSEHEAVIKSPPIKNIWLRTRWF